MFFILADSNENLVDSISESSINVKNGKIVHKESLSNGLLIVEAKQGAQVELTIGAKKYVYSKPAGARVTVLNCEGS